MKVNGIDTNRVFRNFLKYLKRGLRDPHIIKPVSWALYRTWDFYDGIETERKREVKPDGQQ